MIPPFLLETWGRNPHSRFPRKNEVESFETSPKKWPSWSVVSYLVVSTHLKNISQNGNLPPTSFSVFFHPFFSGVFHVDGSEIPFPTTGNAWCFLTPVTTMGFLNHQQYGPNPLRHDIDHQLPDQLELVVAMDSHISVFLPKKQPKTVTNKNIHVGCQKLWPKTMPESNSLKSKFEKTQRSGDSKKWMSSGHEGQSL